MTDDEPAGDSDEPTGIDDAPGDHAADERATDDHVAYDGPATLRAYDPARDADALWALKRAFERSLGSDPAKEAAYAAKLDDDYREGWLAWVDRCVALEPCIRVAALDGPATDALVGYLFVLPETHAYVWDAAVVNEIFVAPPHRGTGLADALLAWALDHARGQTLPMDRVVLDVDRENDRARAFYDRHGFTDWGAMVSREL